MAHSYKVGDTVVPTIGPHKGHPHTVIHVHSTGEVNIKPKGLHRSRNRYRMGAVTAQPQHLNPHTVAESAACPDCGCDPCKCKKIMEASSTPKTDVTPKKFDYKKFSEYRRKHPEKFIAGVKEDYTAMKGKESFMKKKPLDVKYGSRWQVMSHGKTMERPTKEEVEQIDELKKSTMRSYMGKAAQDISGRQMSMFSPNEEPDNLRKINKRYSGIIRAGERMKKEEVELDEARLKDVCWKGYEAIGMKEKGGKKVPNCVPIKEQTPSGGFAGPESAGVPMGGDVSTKTVTGSDTDPKSTRKQEILKGALKSAKDKQKQKLGGKSEFEKDPEYRPLVVTQP